MNKIRSLLSCLLILSLLVSLCACQSSGTEEAAKVQLPTHVPSASELVSDKLVNPHTDWAQYDELLQKINTETDTEVRTRYIREAEEMLMAGYWIIPLYNSSVVYMSKPYVEGQVYSSSSMADFSRIKLTNGNDTLRIGGFSNISNMDPTLSAEASVLAATYLCFRGLTRVEENGKIVNDLAQSIEVADDQLTFTVTLRDDSYWSDGVPITAQNFVYSWQRTTDPQTGAPYEFLFNCFEGYEEGQLRLDILDDRTFVFYLTTPCPYIYDLLSYAPFFALRQDVVEANENWETIPGGWAQNTGFVCSGQYTVNEWKYNSYITFEKNDYYWDHSDNVDRIEILLNADATTVYSAYASGDLDCITSLPSSVISKLLKENDPEIHQCSSFGIYYLALPTNSDFLKDKTTEEAACVRKALCLLIDRNFLSNVLLQDGSTPAGSMIPVGMSDGNGGIMYEDIQTTFFNPTAITDDREGTLNEVRTLLLAAGYEFDEDGTLSDATPLNIEITAYDMIGLYESIQQDFSVIGINALISTQDYSMFFTLRDSGSTQMTSSAWLADFNDPISMVGIFASNSYCNDAVLGQ